MFEKVVVDGTADIPVEYVSRAVMGQLARLMSVDAGRCRRALRAGPGTWDGVAIRSRAARLPR